MGQARRSQTLRRRIKRRLSRKFRYYPLMRLLVLKPWFRAAFLACVAFAVFVAMYLPKMWRVTPEGFMPVIRVSWLDMTQCWALKRSAQKAMAAGDFENAEHSWHMAVAQNPGDLSALRGYLDNFARLNQPEKETAKTAIGQMGWILRLGRTNQSDVLRIARLCDQLGWYEAAGTFLEPLRENLEGEAEAVYLKSLFHQAKFPEFRERWSRSGSRSSDPSLKLYERAYAMGWGKGQESIEAAGELSAATEDPVLGARAARLYMLAAGQQGDPRAYEKGLQRLIVLNESRVEDHAAYWSLLAGRGQKEEAIRLAEGFSTAPRHASEMIRLADVYFRLGLVDSSREVLRRFVPIFSTAPEAWTYYATFLQETKDWRELRNVASKIRDEPKLFGQLWGYSFFLEGLADHRQGLQSGADGAFQKTADATFENPVLGFRVGKELAALNYGAQGLKVLQGVEESFKTNFEFWDAYFNAAYHAKDPEAVLKSAEQAFRLKPRDVHVHNRYAAALMLNRKDPEESIKLTLQLMNAYPQSIAAAINHSFALLLNRREDEARKLLETLSSRRMQPSEANAYHLGLFEVYYNLQLWDKARNEADRVDTSTLFPNQIEAFKEKRAALPERVATNDVRRS